MGFAVVHLEKAKGSDSGMSAHIERTIKPKNADEERTHLNQELIEFPDGIANRTEAIQYRLETAGLQRKIGKNQVRAVRILLTGSPDDMKRIEQSGQLDNWCQDNLDWLKKTYGEENVVSAVLHLDETTPHIHATMIPIVTTERVRKRREEGKKRYRTKNTNTPRLSADDVMSRAKLKEYQNTYAEIMAQYGLKRGIDGSEAKHISTSQYYRNLLNQSESIQGNISALLEEQKEAQSELSRVKSDISKEKLKNSAADVGSKLIDGVSSLLGTPKMAKVELENRELKSEINDLKDENTRLYDRYRSITQGYERKLQEKDSYITSLESKIATLTKQLAEEIKKAKQYVVTRLNRLFNLNPKIKAIDELSEYCRQIGLSDDVVKMLIDGKSLTGTAGNINHYENRDVKIPFKDVKLEMVEQSNGKPVLMLNDTPSKLWLDTKRDEQKQQRQNCYWQPPIPKSKGMKMR